MNLARLDITALASLLRSRRVTPVEVVQASLERIERLDSQLHCLTQVFADEALARARQLAGETPRGPLWGIPWIAKDVLATRLGRTTCGSRLLEEFRSPYDAAVVQRLEESGAILLGKSNMD